MSGENAALSPLVEALAAVEALEARLERAEGAAREPIALVGMGCRFPGADGPDAYWRLLRAGGDAVRRVPADRWDADAWYDADRDAPGKMYTDRGGFLDRVDGFDAAFFGIPPREAVSLDPQQRLLLEVAWEALEDAGLPPDRLAGTSTGVFVGIGSGDYLRLLGDLTAREPYYGTGNAFSAAAGRLSYVLGLEGPCVAVDTACSSSLVAVHLACQALRAGECDAALAGAANVILTPETTLFFCRMGALSPHGRCAPFDAAADGYVRAEGCGVVVLKRLSDALADGDRVLAVIRGSAVNQDGRSQGLTAPSVRAQREVIRRALDRAGVRPEEVAYVEAHGTGTSLGDPVEARALAQALRGEPGAAPLLVGSAKANLGHLEAAAGMAGLLKAVLALRHGEIPPQPHFHDPSPEVDWTALEVPAAPRPWPANGRPRIAGVSSFGFAGTNAHVIVEEAPRDVGSSIGSGSRSVDGGRALLLPVSARSAEALRALASAYRDLLSPSSDDADDADADRAGAEAVCGAAAVRRAHHEHRLAVAGGTGAELAERLGAWLAEGEAPGAAAGRAAAGRGPRIAFLFSGQGGQWAGMGRALAVYPAFREALERCDRALLPHLGRRVSELVLDPAALPDDAPIDQVQPALFAFQVAMAALWRSWGVTPAGVAGHSVGEVAAAHVAGALSLDDAAAVVCARSRLLRTIAGRGAMAVVELPADEARAAIGARADRVAVAAENGPRSSVISGEPAAVDAVLAELQARGVFCRRVRVDVASHSPQVDPLLAPLSAAVAGIAPAATTIAFHSTVTGAPAAGPQLDAAYWARNLREPVRFGAALASLAAAGCDVFVEIGPHPVLLPSVQEAVPGEGGAGPLALPSLRRDDHAAAAAMETLGALYARGARVSWESVYAAAPHADLPRYPWQRERFWVDDAAPPRPSASSPNPTAPTAPETEVSRFYDAGSEYHRRRAEEGAGQAHAAVLEGYLTWGVFPAPEPGFSWLRTVLRPGERPEDQRRLERGQERLRRILFRGVDFARVRRALDFGCGYGADVIALAERHPHLSLEGITLSGRQAEVGAARAAARGLSNRVRVHHGDSTVHPLQGRFDLAMGFEVAGLIADKDALFGHLADHLDDGAVLLLADFVATGTAVEVPEVSAYTPTANEWAAVLARHGLRVLECVDVSRQVAHCLHDPGYAELLSEALADGDLPPELRRHLESYPNTFGVLDRGLMRYVTVRALVDRRSTPREVAAFNRARMERPRTWDDVRDEVDGAVVDGWCHALEWRPALPIEPTVETGGAWLVLADRGGVGQALAARLEAGGASCAVVIPAEGFGRAPAGEWTIDPTSGADFAQLVGTVLAEGTAPRGIIHLWSVDSVDTEDADPLDAAERTAAGVTHLLRAVSAAGYEHPPRLVLVTRGAWAARPGDVPDPARAALHGIGRTIAHEHPELRPLRIDLPAEGDADALVAMLEAEVRSTGAEPEIALRGGERLAPRLVRTDAPGAEVPVRADGAYLVTGGLGGLGMEVARRLAERGAGALVLAGRSAPGDDARDAIDQLRAAGTRVETVRADVGGERGVVEALAAVDATGLALRGVVHAAGVVDDATLLGTDAERIHAVWAPKARGALHLDRLTEGRELDFFVLFSGIAALLGSPGQGAYAAANASLDALAERRRARGLPAVSIAWGPWGETGRVAGDAERFAASGVVPVPTDVGMEAFLRLAAGPAPHVAVFRVERARWLAAYPALAASPLLSLLDASADGGASTEPASPSPTADEAPADISVRAALLAVPAGWKRRRAMEDHLRGEIGRVLRLPAARVEAQSALRDLGFDSLMALELRTRLDRSLGLALPVTLVWSHPTVADLAQSLAERMGIDLDAPASSVSSVTEPDHSVAQGGGAWSGADLHPSTESPLGGAADDLLARLEAMSDDEVERLLAASGEAGDD